MFEFVSSFGISNTWWYRPTYIEHPMIQLAMLGGHTLEKILEAFRLDDEVGLCKCPRCRLPLMLCHFETPHPYCDGPFRCWDALPPLGMAEYHHGIALGLEAQTETDPVGKVLSERVRFD
jgi:hypothetical protein